IASPDADSIADQIELELELHSLEDELDDEEEEPRQFLVKKPVVREESEEEPVTVSAAVNPFTVINPPSTTVEVKRRAQKSTPANALQSASVPQPVATPEKPAAKAPVAKEKATKQKPIKQAPAKVEQVKAASEIAVPAAPAPTASAPAEAVSAVSVEKKVAVAAKPTPKVVKASAVAAAKETKPAPEAVAHRAPAAAEVKPENEVADVDNDVSEFADVDYEHEPEFDDEGHEDVDFHKSSFKWGMLAILAAILITASTILLLQHPLWAPVSAPANADKVVTALASESLYVLTHVDVPRLQKLPGVLQSGSGMKHFPAPDENFWSKLEKAGIDISRQVDHAWIAAYRASGQPESPTQTLWVLTGKFDAEKIRAWLKKTYSIDEDTSEQIVFSTLNPSNCEKQPVMMAVIEADRIIVGAPQHVAAFRGRLDAVAPAEKDLSDWQRISTAQMLSVGIFNPGQRVDASTAIALGKLSIDAAPVKGIYFGLAPRMWPPTLELNGVMVGTEKQFVSNVNSSLAQAIDTAKTTLAKDWPETLPLYQQLKLHQTEEQLQASVALDSRAQAQLQAWASSLMIRTFAPHNEAAPVVTEERFDEKPRSFSALASAKLPEYATTKHLNNAFTAQASAGPFGVGISNIEATDKGVAITLDVNAFNLPNIGKDAESIQLRVTDVVDHQDQSLIANTPCDPYGVRQAARVDMVYEGAFVEEGQSQPKSFMGVQGAKKIQLPENINLSNIGAIKGELEYKLPTKVEKLVVKTPLAGKMIDAHGMQLRFLSAAGTNRLYFQHTGNTDALLQVNALNAQGKVLATTNTVREKNFFSTGTTTTMDAQGQIAAVEVVVASKIEKQTYPFSFGRIQPPEKTFALEKPAPELLTAAKLKDLKQDSPPTDIKYPYQTPLQTVVAGPALIAVNQLDTQSQKLTLLADVYLRNQHPLTRQLSAARLVITEVEDSTGNLHSVNHQVPIALEHPSGQWAGGAYKPDDSQPWLRGQLEMRDQDLGVGDVVALWAKLVFLAPGEPVAIRIPFQFGMQWNGSDSSLKLARWEAGRMLFDIHGSFSELMAITALDDNGVVVSQAAELRSILGVNQVELPVKQRPATIEFSIARNQQTAEFPFELRATP
ncbi:MAG TPA: hypothetical protein VLC79_12840, partial [Cellvibrio sp.]|nr:hypothetical protein [Cellvibrio sp.]